MKKQSKKLTALTISGILATSGASALAEGIGVCTAVQNGMDETVVINAVKDSRALWVRDSMGFESLYYTNTDGVYKVNPESVAERKEYYKELKKAGKKTIMILGYGSTASQFNNSNRMKIPSPDNAAYWEGWQEYVKYIATEFKGLVDVYEVWNEQDHEPFNADVSNSSTAEDAAVMEAYVTLLKQTYKDVKSVDSDAKVATGGFAHGDTYLDEFFTAVGSEKCFDIFAGHTYNHGNYDKLESAFRGNLDDYDKMLDKYNYDGDFYMTENGWFTGTESRALSEEEQAAGLIRNKVIWDDFLSDNGRGGEYIWYCGVDTGNNLLESESNYGLYTFRSEAKESGKAAKALSGFIGDKEFVSLEETSTGLGILSSKKYTYKAKYENLQTGALTYIVWGDGTSINIPGGEVYNADGTKSGESSEKITLSDDNPKFVNIDVSGTSIIDAEYNSYTGMIKLTGRAYDYEGDIEIYATIGDAEEWVFAPQDEFGYFEAEISAPASGDVEVYANYEGYATVTVDGGFEEVAEKSEITSSVAMYNGKTNKVTVSAGFKNCSENEAVKVLVVPYGAEEITDANIEYIDEFKVSDSENTEFSFNLPKDTEKGKYSVYLRLTNSEKEEDAIYKNMVEVGSFTYGANGTVIKAKAEGLGYDEAMVEKAVIIIAQYDSENRLITTSVSDSGINGKTKEFSADAAGGASVIKAMLLKDMTTLVPLADIAVSE